MCERFVNSNIMVLYASNVYAFHFRKQWKINITIGLLGWLIGWLFDCLTSYFALMGFGCADCSCLCEWCRVDARRQIFSTLHSYKIIPQNFKIHGAFHNGRHSIMEMVVKFPLLIGSTTSIDVASVNIFYIIRALCARTINIDRNTISACIPIQTDCTPKM